MSSGLVWGLGGVAMGVWSWIGLGQTLPKIDAALEARVHKVLVTQKLDKDVHVEHSGQAVILISQGPESRQKLTTAEQVLAKALVADGLINGPITVIRTQEASPSYASMSSQVKTIATAPNAVQIAQPAATVVSTLADAKTCEDALVKQIGDRKLSFKFNGYELTPEDGPIIDDIYKAMQACPTGVKLVIEGHTDAVGDAETNRLLSKGRAGSAANALMTKGLSADRVQFEGYGADKPIADNKSAEGRAQNRRVVFHIVKP